MKKVLFLDRGYASLYIKTDLFEPIFVALSKHGRKKIESIGQSVVACFEEEYDSLPVEDISEKGYLDFSFYIDRFLKGRFDLAKRKEILGKEISFWRRVLSENKPDLIVNEVCALEWAEVLNIEARNFGIPYKAFLAGSRLGRLYWLDTPYNSELSDKRFKEAVITDEIKKDARKLFEETAVEWKKPFFLPTQKVRVVSRIILGLKFYLVAIIKHILYWGKFQYEDYRSYSKFNLCNIFAYIVRKYDKLPANPEVEYLFYPLHIEPEATVLYFGEFYSEQESNVLNIAKCLKSNQVLVVKEHPRQFGVLQTKRFQNVKKAQCNILYVPYTVSSNEIMNKCKAIVTVTGTAGFEGLMMGKPVITLGHVYYNACSEVMHVNSYDELKEIIRHDAYKIPNQVKVMEFLASFMAIQKKGDPYIRGAAINEKFLSDYIESIHEQLRILN